MSDGLIELAFDGARRRLAGEVRHLGDEASAQPVTPARRLTVSASGGGGAPLYSRSQGQPTADVSGRPDLFAIEQRCNEEWARSASIRAEFGRLEVYVAYRKAEAKGLVRIFGGRRREA